MNKKNNIIVILLYLFTIVIFLRGIIFSRGIIIGGDWGLPLTQSQMYRYFQSAFYTWSDRELFGTQQFFLNSLPFQLLIGLLAKIGITGDIYTKLLLIFAFVFPAYTMYLFFRFLNCEKKVAIFSGFLFCTMPFFFNYAAMGWVFVLLAMGILPISLIFFIRSVKEEKISYSIITGILYFLAMVQSQSIIWFPIVFFLFSIYLVHDKKSFYAYTKSLLIILFIFLGLNTFWWLPLFFSERSGTLNTSLGGSSISLGTWVKLNPVNILKGWGSLFNYQYETTYPKALIPFSFVLPIIAYSSLLFLRRTRIVYSLAAISLVLMILFLLGPGFIVKLPFSDFIRDVARFSSLSSFAFVTLAALVLNFLFDNKKPYSKYIAITLCFLLVINTYPFWAGELTGKQQTKEDIRLRTYDFPSGYTKLENFIKKEGVDTKILYIPIGTGLRFIDNDKFYGLYKGAPDIFASYSPKQGMVGISDKSKGLNIELGQKIDTQQFADINELLNLMGIKYLAVRKNVSYAYSQGKTGNEISSSITQQTNMKLIQDFGSVSLIQNDDYYPHFYIPNNIVFSNTDSEDLPDVLSLTNLGENQGKRILTKPLFIEGKINQDIVKPNIASKEILVKAYLDNGITENTVNKKQRYTDDFELPYTRWRPGSFIYSLISMKEQFNEQLIGKNKQKMIDMKLFIAGKRIAEIIKFPNMTQAWKDKTRDSYQKRMEEAIAAIKQLDITSSDAIEQKKFFLIKLRISWEMHKKKLEENHVFKNWETVFEKLDKEISPLEIKFDLTKLEYSFELPQDGEYEILAKKEENTTMDIVKINGKNFNTNSPGNKQNDWLSFGKENLSAGKNTLALFLSDPQNLIGNDWIPLKQVKINKNEVMITSSTGLPQAAEDLVFQSIPDWQSNNFYYLSFDYQVKEGKLGVMVTEQSNQYDAKNEPDKKNIFDKVFVNSNNQWSHFETVMQANGSTRGASISFYDVAASHSKTNVYFRNVKIYHIIQPDIFLRHNLETSTDIKNKPIPIITYVKINPTKYKVHIQGVKGPYTLTFSESFHEGWKLYWANRLLPESRHMIANNYANSWYITPEDNGKKEDYDLIIEFGPQKLFYIGALVSFATLVSISFIMIKRRND